MNKFVRNLLTEWRKLELPFENEKIIIAVSGGADSVSLALALHELKERKKLRHNFVIAHFNHDLRGSESVEDAGFVRNLAEKLQFEFIFKKQNPDSKLTDQRGNLEQNARLARYNFLSEVAEQLNAHSILTAHTKNDQAETLLINLIRGSGIEGLSGIKIVQKKEQYYLIRPLINWANRKDTENFCFEKGYGFRNDSMNEDEKFTRVRIRKEIIPLLETLNPRLIDTLSQTAILLQNEAEKLQINDNEIPEILDQNDFKDLPKFQQLSVLRAWLQKQRGDLRQLGFKHFEAIIRLIKSRKSGQFVQLPNDEIVLKRSGKIFFEKTRVEKTCSGN